MLSRKVFWVDKVPFLCSQNKLAPFLFLMLYDLKKDGEIVLPISSTCNIFKTSPNSLIKAVKTLRKAGLIKAKKKGINVVCTILKKLDNESFDIRASVEDKVNELLKKSTLKIIHEKSNKINVSCAAEYLDVSKGDLIKYLKENPSVKEELQTKIREVDEVQKKVSYINKDLLKEPTKRWNSEHLLAYFCELYEKQYRVDYGFTAKNIYKSKEMKDMSRVHSFFESAQEAINYMDWFFRTKLKSLKSAATTGIVAYNGLLNEYKTVQVKKPKILDGSFVEWIKKNFPKASESHNFNTIKDLMWLEDAVKNKDVDSSMGFIIKEAKRREILQ